MKAGLIVAAAMAAIAQAADECPAREKKELDRRPGLFSPLEKGAGRLCPRTFCKYLDKLNGVFDSKLLTSLSLTKELEDDEMVLLPVMREGPLGTQEPLRTSDGTGTVYSGTLKGYVGREAYQSFAFVSKFTGLEDHQVKFLEALYDPGFDEESGTPKASFSPVLDPTYKVGEARVLRTLDDELGVPSTLQRTEFKFIEPFERFDRELVFVSGWKKIELEDGWTCTVLGNPSVSNRWIRRDLGWGWLIWSWVFLFGGEPRFRAQNLYPSGDRLCLKKHTDGTTEAELSHLITTDIGGILGWLRSVAPPSLRLLIDSFLDPSQADAYQTEAQILENCIKGNCPSLAALGGDTPAPRVRKSAQVVEGPGGAEAQAVSSELGGPASSCRESWAVLAGVLVTGMALALVIVLATAKYLHRAPKTPAAEPPVVDATAAESGREQTVPPLEGSRTSMERLNAPRAPAEI